MKKFLAVAVIAAMALMAVPAFAYDVKVDEDTFAKVGTKAQILVSNTMPDPGDNEVDVKVPNARIYFAGQVTNVVKFGFNYDFGLLTGASSAARATDAFVMLDFMKELKVITGVYRVAFSRLALQDSYQYILVSGPEVANSVAPLNNGTLGTYRNAGISAWGDLIDGKLRYNIGIWDDDYSPVASGATAAGDDNYMQTVRLVFNILDPEKGYTCAGCYLGKAKIANIGVGYLMQDYKEGTGTRTAKSMTVDAFVDMNGITAEAAFFVTDKDSGIVGATNQEPAGFYAEVAYLINDKIQPAVRFESFDNDGTTTAGDYDKIVAGVNYLFAGQDAKIGLEYAMKDFDTSGTTDVDTLSVQLQVQF